MAGQEVIVANNLVVDNGVANVVSIIDADPFDNGGIYDLSTPIRNAKAVLTRIDEVLTKPLPVVPNDTIWKVIEILEDNPQIISDPNFKAKRRAIVAELRGIATETIVHQGWIQTWKIVIDSLTKMVKVGGDHRMAKEDRITQAQMHKLFLVVTSSLNRHVRDAKVLQALITDIQAGIQKTGSGPLQQSEGVSID